MKTIIKHGSKLSPELIKLMVDNRIREYGKNTKDFEHAERNSTFFFLYKGNKVKAFAMLKPVILYHQNKKYPIMGLANVMALEKSKGYGTKIMESVTNYLRENNLSALGNTYKDNFTFYKKCGYSFIPDLINRMTYKNLDGKKEKTESENYDMFIYDPNHTLDKITFGSDEIIIKVPFW